LPILAVPTTYAGSEMTPIWGLTDGGRKTTGRDRTVLPVEGLYAPDASPVTAVLAEEGIRVLADALPAGSGCTS